MKFVTISQKGETVSHCILSGLRHYYDMLQHSDMDNICIVVINNDVWTRYSREELFSRTLNIRYNCIEQNSTIFWIKQSISGHPYGRSHSRYSPYDKLVTETEFRKNYL